MDSIVLLKFLGNGRKKLHAVLQAALLSLTPVADLLIDSLQNAARVDLNAMAFPTDWEVPWQARPYWQNWMPTGEAQGSSATAIWEYLALAFDYRAGITK